MWLLNCTTNELQSFISDDDVPPYAILSHTWGKEEATFQDWQAAYSSQRQYGALPEDWKVRNLSMLQALQGYKKIGLCQRQAYDDGLQWVWVDTCCIDKQSSAELSEAINSMYRWYRKSAVCYAYLEDVVLEEGETIRSYFGHSRWFTRGWTLQELLAPSNVVFYTQNWKNIGTKTSLGSLLQSATGIEKKFLIGDVAVHDTSIAKRMSWASKRNTTRIEDTAYSLLGIFDINMPLLYGEGARAFERLQRTLLREFPRDYTLYAWGNVVYIQLTTDPFEEEERLAATVPIRHSETPQPLRGLLADSPRDFSGSASFIPVPWVQKVFEYRQSPLPATVIGRGIQIDLPLQLGGAYLRHLTQPPVTQIRQKLCILLLCADETDKGVGLIITVLYDIGGYQRTEELLKHRTLLEPVRFQNNRSILVVPPDRTRRDISHGSVVIRSTLGNDVSIFFGVLLEQKSRREVAPDRIRSPGSGRCAWYWPVFGGVKHERHRIFEMSVTDAAHEDTGIISTLELNADESLLVGHENGLFKAMLVYWREYDSLFWWPILSSKVFSDSSRDSAEFALIDGKRALVTVERVFFAGGKFVDVFDLKVEK